MSQHEAVLLLGSNLGDSKRNVKMALELLQQSDCRILIKSKIIETEAVEFASTNIFRNIAVLISTHFSPAKLLENVKRIEVQMGRINDSAVAGHYTDRVIDIDIVTFDRLIFFSKKLKVPHNKHLFERAFSQELLNDLKTHTKS
jgi:2-amino-4-hydroxy-6-hydroxymethyldihydropteridine diphosphokinase